MAKQVKRKVLIVDDEADFNEIMKLRFESNGYDVIVANNGEEGLRLFKRERPDVVCLDIMMPGTDGLAVLKSIREADPEVPVFMITAFSNEERIKLAAKLNASGFIVKSSQDISEEIKNINAAVETAAKYKDKRG